MPIIKVPISDDERPAFVEFDVEDDWGTGPLANRPGGAARKIPSLASSLDAALPALKLVLSKVRSTVSECDEICLQLGLRVGGETGLVFVRGGADATIAVTVTWRKPDHHDERPDDARVAGEQVSGEQLAGDGEGRAEGADGAG